MIYLDNAATTRVSEVAAQAGLTMMREEFGNPSALHGLGIRAERAVNEARANIARILGADPSELIFTSGGSEGNNTAIFGAAHLKRRRERHIVTTQVEHASVLSPLNRLEEEGYEITRLAPGEITPAGVAAVVREDTGLVSIMHVNNETGAVYPIGEIVRAIHRKNADTLVHTDAVQSFCKLPFDVHKLGVDFATVSGHKVHAPKGVGALFIRRGVRLPPLILGGGQERGLRSGTEATPLICALGTVKPMDTAELCALRDHLRETLATLSQVRLLPMGDAPHILSMSIPGTRSEVAMRILEEEEIYVSAGSACSRGRRSHVLEAMGIPNEDIDCALRVSLSDETTYAELDAFVQAIQNRF